MNQETGLYIVLLSIHGLIRGEDPELGRDADTGGQVQYVLELARLLETTGDTEGSREQYRRFLELWRDADENLPDLQEARRQVTR